MADHIRIRDADGTWSVRAGGAVLGETDAALELTEGSYPPVIYFPRDGIAMAFLEKSDKTSVCPQKGTANYYSIITKSTVLKDAVWSYETPHEDVSRIAGHLAFYTGDLITVEQL